MDSSQNKLIAWQSFYSKDYSEYTKCDKLENVLQSFSKTNWEPENVNNRISVLFCDSKNYTYDNYFINNYSFQDIENEKLFTYNKENLIKKIRYLINEQEHVCSCDENFKKILTYKINISSRILNEKWKFYPIQNFEDKILVILFLLNSNLDLSLLEKLDEDTKLWRNGEKEISKTLTQLIHSYHFIDFILFSNTAIHFSHRLEVSDDISFRKIHYNKDVDYIIDNTSLFNVENDTFSNYNKIKEHYFEMFSMINFNEYHSQIKNSKNIKGFIRITKRVLKENLTYLSNNLDFKIKRKTLSRSKIIEKLNMLFNDKDISIQSDSLELLLKQISYYGIKHTLMNYKMDYEEYENIYKENKCIKNSIIEITDYFEVEARDEISFKMEEVDSALYNEDYKLTRGVEFLGEDSDYPNYLKAELIKFPELIQININNNNIIKTEIIPQNIVDIIDNMRNKVHHNSFNIYEIIEEVVLFLESINKDNLPDELKEIIEIIKEKVIKISKKLNEESNKCIRNCIDYHKLNKHWVLYYDNSNYIKNTWLDIVDKWSNN